MKFMSILISKTILQGYIYHTSSLSFRKLCPLIEKEKCLLQPVGIVEMNVKYHSSQKKTGLFIAQNVSKNINKISKLFFRNDENYQRMIYNGLQN